MQRKPALVTVLVGLSAVGLVLLAGTAILFMASYNHLVAGKNQISQAQQQVDNVLNRRYAVLMNQGAVVADYKESQQKLVEQFTQAITASTAALQQDNHTLESTQKLDQATSQGVLALYTLGKAAVKSDPTVWQSVLVEIEGSNNRVSTERKRLIDAINAQQNRVEQFPGNVFASLYGFSAPKRYEAPPETLQNPDLKAVLHP